MYSYKVSDINTDQSELRVTDWYYQDIGYASNNCILWIAIAIIHYRNILKTISEKVIISGNTHDSLVEFLSIFEELTEIMKEVGEQYRILCNRFISDVDEWDQFVYQESKSARITRDFSDSKLNSIKRYLKTTPPGGSELMTNVLSWTLGTCFRGCQEIGNICDNAKRCRSTYIANLANLKNCDAKELGDIFDRVKKCDKDYAWKFGLLYDELTSVLDVLKKANDTMEKKTAFDSSSIIELKGMIERLRLLKEKTNVELDIVASTDPSIEEISDFTADFKNQYIFIDFSSELNNFVYDISDGDTFLLAILQGSKIISTHYGTITIPPEVPNEKHYEYVMLKKQLAEIIADIADSKVETSAESYERVKDIISKFKDSKYFSSDYQKYKDIYDTIYASVGAIEDGLDIGLDVSEIIIHLFADYLENEKVIASLATSAEEDSLLYIAVQQLQAEYKSTYLRGLNEFVDFATTTLTKETIKEGTKLVLSFVSRSAGSFYSLVNFGIKTAGEISGMTEHVGSKLEFCTLFNSLSDIEHAYQNNFANVAAGNTSEQDILNLQNSFEVLKRTYSKLYKIMGDSVGATGDINKQAYYSYVARNIEKTSIPNGVSKVVSYEDFLNNDFSVR